MPGHYGPYWERTRDTVACKRERTREQAPYLSRDRKNDSMRWPRPTWDTQSKLNQGWSFSALPPPTGRNLALLQRRPNQSGSPMQWDKEVTILWKFVSIICQTSPNHTPKLMEMHTLSTKIWQPAIQTKKWGKRFYIRWYLSTRSTCARVRCTIFARNKYIHEEYSGDTQSVHLSPLGVSDSSRRGSANDGVIRRRGRRYTFIHFNRSHITESNSALIRPTYLNFTWPKQTATRQRISLAHQSLI